MKLHLIRTRVPHALQVLLAVAVLISTDTKAQVCVAPDAVIYGLTASGAIYPINVSNASLGTVIKNTSYSPYAANRSNGLAYNNTNGKFYYFKRNVGYTAPVQFVSYDPGTTAVSVLASTTCTSETHTGCITADGKGYYTIDIDANLNYYDIITNTWTFITSNFTDQFGNNVSTVIRAQNAGDIAFDGNGSMWIVTSNTSNYGLYTLAGPQLVAPVASVTVTRRIAPTTPTPTGRNIAGIAFNSTGQIFMSTKTDDRLYRLENNLTLTYKGTFPVTDVGNDLTSCTFPLGVLPLTWMSFTATLQNEKCVLLNWQIAEKSTHRFQVQHSTDGNNWITISLVEVQTTDTEGQLYAYLHNNPPPGNNYYRIKTSNEDGKDAFSQTRMVFVKIKGSLFTIWPNPGSALVNITADSYGVLQVRIIDLAGRLQLDKQLKAGETSFTVSSLKPGIYLLSIYTQTGTVQSQKFIKQ
ncbi:MAG: T9SS type A sorting domain-containing protein [Chitinophagaceae bacterium]